MPGGRSELQLAITLDSNIGFVDEFHHELELIPTTFLRHSNQLFTENDLDAPL